MSRRDFFLGTFSKAEPKQEAEIVVNPEFVVGRIADFPIGKDKLLTLLQVKIESLPEGLRARSIGNDPYFYSIKANHIGELVVNRMEFWPANQVFSILTNEPTCLDTSLEDRS